MSKIEIFSVRYVILAISIYLLLIIANAYNGVSLSSQEYLSGHALITDSLLAVLCWNNNKYHCRYMFALCINLILVDIIGYTHANFIKIEPKLMLDIYSCLYAISSIITIILAIRHYVLKKKNRYQEYKIK